MAGRSYVMMGSLGHFTLRQVLEVVGLSRQHTVIEVHGDDGSSLVSLNLKGGHLVKSSADANDPRVSLGRALRAPDSSTFEVFRLDDADTYQSFGQLTDLLADEKSLASTAPPVTVKAIAAPPSATAVELPASWSAPSLVEPSAPSGPSLVTPAPGPAPSLVTSAAPAPAPAPVAPRAPSGMPSGPAATIETPTAPVSTESKAIATPDPDTQGVSLAVASPKGGVGKTTIALNLGISFANRGLRVILIDADINGDLLSLINQRGSAEVGTYDLLRDPGRLDRALRRTVVHGLQVLPASNRELREALIAVDRTASWRALIREAMSQADVVLVDCPAGISHTTLEILQGVTHVLGVFQAETVASRSFEMFERALATLGDDARPIVAGVVVNMLRQETASARAYEGLVAGDATRRVLQTAITRSEAFEEAAAAATPVRLHSGDASRKMAWLFDNLATELASRLRLAQPPSGKARAFMI